MSNDELISVSHKDYMKLADAYDEHSRTLMTAKGEEYSTGGDFLAMENRLAGMLGDSPEYVSLVMAGKHITALGIILQKNPVTEIKLEKLDERIRDATNLLKITGAFIHAKQNDFSLHLDKAEKKFVVPEGWRINEVKSAGWCVHKKYTGQLLQKDNQLHNRTGWHVGPGFDDGHKYGEAPGYWSTKEAAEAALEAYLEKQQCGKTG